MEKPPASQNSDAQRPPKHTASQRYGSDYSPDTSADQSSNQHRAKTPPRKRPFDGKRPSQIGARSNLLFFASLPLAFKAFGASPTTMVAYIIALGCLVGAAFLTREGLKAEEAYNARRTARRPAFPRKIAGSLLTGLGLGIVGIFGWGVVEAGLFAILGGVLHMLAFGIDPLKDKGMEGIDTFQQDRVARVVDQAEAHLDAMQSAIKATGDREAARRLENFAAAANKLCRTVEEDPHDLAAARKYLGVYLQGARDATLKYTDLWTRARDTQSRDKWFALLDDLEENFASRNEALLLDNKSDLDIEIDVLRDRLAREGIKR